MLRYETKPRPGLVALYDIWPGNGAGLFLQSWSPHGAIGCKNSPNKMCNYIVSAKKVTPLDSVREICQI